MIWVAGRLLTLRRERIERVTIADRNIESAQKLAQTLAGKKEMKKAVSMDQKRDLSPLNSSPSSKTTELLPILTWK